MWFSSRLEKNKKKVNSRRGRRPRRTSHPLRLESLERRELLTTTVSVEATDPEAAEGSGVNTGAFTFTRTGDTSGSLRVYFQLTGTATYNDDYYPMGATQDGNGNWIAYVDFYSGYSTAVAYVSTQYHADGLIEGNETVIATVVEDSSCCGYSPYTVGSPSAATVTILDEPAVYITAVDREAVEPKQSGDTPNKGSFLIYRTGDLSSAMTVNYAISGDAQNGVDYVSLQTSVEIPAGESGVVVMVEPYFDATTAGTEGEENVTLTVQPADGGDPCCCSPSGYAIGSPSEATVTISDTGEETPKNCACSCSCDPEAAQIKYDAVRGGLWIKIGGTWQYFSPANPHPIITTDVKLSPTNGFGSLTKVEATLDLGGVQSPTVHYSGTGVQSGQLYRFALQADASTLETGMHPWEMTIVQRYSDGSSTTRTYYGQQVVNNRRESEFGNRWSLVGEARLVAHEYGVDIITGEGNVISFWEDGQGGWRSEPGSGFLTLTGNATTGYTLRDKYGNESEFNASGFLTVKRDRVGNETTYTYTGGKLTQITDPAGETTTIAYGGDGLLDTVTDHAGRVTTFNHDASGRLASITQPDPDGAGPKAAPVTSFGYNATSHLMTSLTDAENNTTTFGYDFAGTLQTITHPDQTQISLRSVHVKGMVDTSSGAGTSSNPAPLVLTSAVQGELRDELNELTTFQVDRFGQFLKTTDALGNVTTYERNSHGQVTRVVEPDPDGAGPLTAPETLYQYDAKGNLTQITYPDSSTESWVYHATFNVPTQYTDPLGNVTFFVLDTANGLVLQERRIVGVDDRSSSETDDVVTVFTYTPTPTLSTDPPAGLVKTVTDPLGRLTRLDYNEHGLVTKITYAVGTADEAFVQFEYDNAHNLTAAIDELARRAEYIYDALDRLIQITLPDPDGAGSQTSPIYTFEYDKNNRLAKETDLLGRQTTYAYSDRGELLTVTRPDHDGDSQPTVTTMTYTAREELDTITDPLGRVTDFLYDALGRNTQVTLPDPDGAGSQTAPVTTFAYDNLGRFVQVLDALNNPTDAAYANFGRTITNTQADPDGAGAQTRPQTTSQFDAAGNLTSTTDALGIVTTYEYDELNRLVKVTLPDPDGAGAQTSPVYQYQYDKAGNLRFETDPLGNVTEYQYDARNRLVKIIAADPDGAGSQTSPVTNLAYDDAGQLISETDPLGNVTTYEYDNLGRLTKVTAPDPDGAGPQLASQTTFTYDAVGNLLTVTDALNQTTTYQYDAHNNRTKIIDAELGETVFTFDDVGNLLTLTDPELNTTSWVYDGLDRVTQETNELNATRYFVYNAVGNLTRRTDRNGRVTEYDYDNLHRLTAERWMNGANTVRTLSYGYDANSQLLSASDPAAAYTYAYDNLGRTTDVVHDLAALSFNVELLSEYDAASNRTDLKSLVGGTADFWNEYQYDDLHRLTSVQQHGAAGGSTVAEKRVDFAYDAASRWQTITRYEDLSGFELVATSNFTFDDAGRLTDLTHAKGANTLADYGWTYDVGNRITAFTSPDGSSTYTYDDTDQLVSADHTYQTDETYTYDANGNRTNTGYSTGTNNRLLSDGTYNYQYDAEGNRTRRTNIATGDYVDYEWDYRNRLTAVRFKTSTGAITKQVEYEYDLFDRRTAKRVDANGDSVYESAYRFVYDGQDIVLVFDETGSLEERYLHGPAVDQVLASEDAVGDVLWSLPDNQGTVRDIAAYDAATDTTTIENHRKFDAFGKITAESAPAVDFLYAYTGREWDADAELYYYRARWYDPVVGGFLSEDPIYDDYNNPYRYVGNAPTNATDPTGLAEYVEEDYWRGMKNGRTGYYYQRSYYEWNWWYPVERGIEGVPQTGPLEFVPDCVNYIPDPGGTGSRLSQSKLHKVANGAKTAVELGAAAVFIAGMVIPGPDDAIWAALGSKYGLKLIGKGGEWFIEKAGKRLRGKELDEALELIDEARKVTPKGYNHLSDGTMIAPGRLFRPHQKKKILEANCQRNGGKLMSDDPNDPWYGKELQAPGPRRYAGDIVPPNEAQVDHIVPRIGPDGKPLGTNDYSNARVISQEYNNFLRNKKPNVP